MTQPTHAPRRCIVCDGTRLAAEDPEAAIAVVALAAQVSLDGLKATMCPDHRRGWALALLRGGTVLEAIQAEPDRRDFNLGRQDRDGPGK